MGVVVSTASPASPPAARSETGSPSPALAARVRNSGRARDQPHPRAPTPHRAESWRGHRADSAGASQGLPEAWCACRRRWLRPARSCRPAPGPCRVTASRCIAVPRHGALPAPARDTWRNRPPRTSARRAGPACGPRSSCALPLLPVTAATPARPPARRRCCWTVQVRSRPRPAGARLMRNVIARQKSTTVSSNPEWPSP